MDKVDKASNNIFERAKMHVTFLYHNLGLSDIDMFKVIEDGHLVDEEDELDQEAVPKEEENIFFLEATSVNKEG